MVEMGFPSSTGPRRPRPGVGFCAGRALFGHHVRWCPNLDPPRFRLIRNRPWWAGASSALRAAGTRPVPIGLPQRPRRRHQRARAAGTLGRRLPEADFSIVHTFELRDDNRAQVRYVLARIIWYVKDQMNRPVDIEN